MAKKNLIIGGCTNYGINQLKPWVLSVLETAPEADKVMCIGNASSETRTWLQDCGFKLVDMPNLNIPVHVLRFLSIHNFLKDNYLNYNYVVTTDVKDVIFQSDPFEYLSSQDSIINIIAGSESIAYKDEPWGDDNLKSAYGPYVYEMYKDKIIYNVGTIGGQSGYVKDLIFNIFTNAINRPIPIVDQAVFNVLIHTVPLRHTVFFADQKDGWAVQAGTTADPSKIEYFRPNLVEAEPIFEDGVVKTGEDGYNCTKGTPFVIVHQYDRVPEWKEYFYNKYGVEDESQYFTYKI